jgi:hypothetical protein
VKVAADAALGIQASEMRSLCLLLSVLGCSGNERFASERHAPAPVAPGPAKAAMIVEVVFHGACDASGAVPLSERRFVVADDEDNVLRVYDADVGGAPLSMTDLSSQLDLPLKGKKRPRAPELDLEAATRIGDRAYWVTSHGRNPKGKVKPERLRLFATSTLGEGDTIEVVGIAYEGLVDDLIAAPQLASLGLAEAAERPPREAGGLNIEGLTAGPDGEVLLAFRNPVPDGKALLVPILNIADLVDEQVGGPARFGEPVLLDLADRGVRSLSWWRGQYLLIAGDREHRVASSLYTWDGRGAPVEVTAIDLSIYNPEGFFTPEDRAEILVLNDDGEREIDGTPCKKLKAPARKQFRGVWLVLP